MRQHQCDLTWKTLEIDIEHKIEVEFKEQEVENIG